MQNNNYGFPRKILEDIEELAKLYQIIIDKVNKLSQVKRNRDETIDLYDIKQSAEKSKDIIDVMFLRESNSHRKTDRGYDQYQGKV